MDEREFHQQYQYQYGYNDGIAMAAEVVNNASAKFPDSILGNQMKLIFDQLVTTFKATEYTPPRFEEQP